MDRIKIIGQTFDEERALYHISGEVESCIFAGPADGESALKECRNVVVRDCKFSLRYPLWHTEDFTLIGSLMDELTRAPIWYAKRGEIVSCDIKGIKCLRECDDIRIEKSSMVSPEFGWRTRGLEIVDSYAEGEYFLFECSGVTIRNLQMKGKYSFQYVENMTIETSKLDTKDAFWHSKNVTVYDTELKGEYLGWYSENLTLIRCHITGTQPLCYCKNLKLIDCTTDGCDLSFEYSDVDATVLGHIHSVKNPASGRVVADSIGEVIWEDSVIESSCDIIENSVK